MMPPPIDSAHSATLDAPTRLLVRLSAQIAAASEDGLRAAIGECNGTVEPRWIEELVLQSYLFAGFPRALNAAREWRRVQQPSSAPHVEPASAQSLDEWRLRGERTCNVVYGDMYAALRRNVQALHPSLDEWMIIEGYGKVLSRPGLDLRRRELCIVAACAATRQDRQLQSHLHGALHAGASASDVTGTLDALADLLDPRDLDRAGRLWAKVRER